MSGHTPGPWYVGAQNDMLFITAGRAPSPSNDHPNHDADRTVIASVSQENESANAPVLAAAPDLLKAMRAILEGFDRGIFVRSIADDANSAWAIKLFPYLKALADGQAAIAKAEGR